MSNKIALILGVTGQDGALLAQLLLDKSYTVIGQSRSSEKANLGNLQRLNILNKIDIKYISLLDKAEVESLIREVSPDEVYNLSGQSSVGQSYIAPLETAQSHVSSTLNILEAIRKISNAIRLFNAGSGECFGDVKGIPATENTAFCPVSPYGVSKAASSWYTSVYRDSYSMYACTGIFFNHESALRTERFVTKKIAMAAYKISCGSEEKFSLGNINVIRDWGWAQDYVEAAWKMLNRQAPEDFIIATGVPQSLHAFAEAIFLEAGLELDQYLNIDHSLFRANEPSKITADISKAKDLLSWEPNFCGSEVAKKLYIDTVKAIKKGNL